MGAYIKGMEMPEICKLCYLSEFDPGFYAYVCKPTGIRIDYDMAKIDRPRTICPLVPVPEHGRLGDLDKLIDKVIAKYLEHERKGELVFAAAEVKQDIVDLISDAPVIIPAEEGEA